MFKTRLSRLAVVLVVLMLAFLASDFMAWMLVTTMYDYQSPSAAAGSWEVIGPADYYGGAWMYGFVHFMGCLLTVAGVALFWLLVAGIHGVTHWIISGSRKMS